MKHNFNSIVTKDKGEKLRLKALYDYQILDTEFEEEFE